MASGRFLSITIADDDRLSRLSLEAEFLFIKTIPHLDRDGLISGKPGLLFSRVCPTREALFGKTQVLMDEWVAVGLVMRFDSAEGQVLFFPGFAKNNKLPHYERERPSRFPPPPGFARDGKDGPLYPAHQKPPSKAVKKPKVAPPSEDAQRVPEPIVGNLPLSQDEVMDEVQDEVMDEVQELLLDEVQDEVPILGTEEQEQEQEQDQDQEEEGEGESGYAAPPPTSTDVDLNVVALKPGQHLYKAVCEILGWDTKTLSSKSQILVAEAVKKLMAAGYTCDELERFMGEVWALDWRWTKKKQRPNLEEFQAEVGKLHAGAAQTKRSYSGSYERAEADDAVRRKQYSQYNDLLPKLPKGKPS